MIRSINLIASLLVLIGLVVVNASPLNFTIREDSDTAKLGTFFGYLYPSQRVAVDTKVGILLLLLHS